MLEQVLRERGLLDLWWGLDEQERQAWVKYVRQATPAWRVGRLYEAANRIADGQGVPRGWRAWWRLLFSSGLEIPPV